MRLPTFGKNSRLTAVIPDLSGGVDHSRAPWLIADNALADSNNVCWKDGALRTRNGFYTTRGNLCTVDGSTCRFFTDRDGWIISAETADIGSITYLSLRAVSNDGLNGRRIYYQELPLGASVCCVPSGGELGEHTTLLFISSGQMAVATPSRNEGKLLEGGAYVPLVQIDGKPVTALSQSGKNGVRYEQFNRLTGKFRCHFTADGSGLYYFLPQKPVTGEVTVETIAADGTTATFTVAADKTVSGSDASGTAVRVDRTRGYVCFEKSGTVTARAGSGALNDVRVTATAIRTDTLTPYLMSFGDWYGSRLFLAGHPDYPDRMIWSAADDPTYFPEDNWVSVGAPRSPITAFAKQDGVLVIFKKREIYAARYEANTDAEAGEPTAQFPLTPLHTAIGCDLPYTPALLGNRLVWACSDGSVYRLSSITSEDISGVTTVGEAVVPLLERSPSVAFGQVCEGQYHLLWNRRLLSMAYDSRPVWYSHTWHEPDLSPSALCCADGNLLIAGDRGSQRWWFTLSGDRDVFPTQQYAEAEVTGMLCTKSYDFGSPETFKSVLGVAAEVTAAVEPVYVTEQGEFADRRHTPDRSGLVHCTPHIDRCRRLAIRLSGKTAVIGRITLHLRGEMR